MGIYILDAAVNQYQDMVPISDDDCDVMGEFDGTPIDPCRFTLRVVISPIASSPDEQHLPGDFPGLETSIPVFSKRACDVFRDLIEPYGQFLPLVCEQGDYTAFNVTTVVDALDYERSKVLYFKTSQRIMDVHEYVLRRKVCDELPIFKLVDLTRSHMFVSDAFIDVVERHNLLGFDFRRVRTVKTISKP